MNKGKMIGGLTGLCLLVLSAGAFAEDDGSANLMQKLRALRPDLPITAVNPSPVQGFYAIELQGGTFLYGSADARFLFAGDLYQLGTSLVNVTDSERATKRAALLAKVPVKDALVFTPKNGVRKSIYVFTDVDCTYCRKLHSEIAAINDLGIEVRYLAYPRSGINSESYNRIVSAWCADNPQEALTTLKAGGNVPVRTCTNPVADEYRLGQELGISGTPAILTEDGQLLPGYMPPKQLALAIGLN